MERADVIAWMLLLGAPWLPLSLVIASYWTADASWMRFGEVVPITTSDALWSTGLWIAVGFVVDVLLVAAAKHHEAE